MLGSLGAAGWLAGLAECLPWELLLMITELHQLVLGLAVSRREERREAGSVAGWDGEQALDHWHTLYRVASKHLNRFVYILRIIQ